MKPFIYSSRLPKAENSSWVIGTIMVIGAVVTAVGQYRQGQANKAMAEANADIADQEAKQQLAVARMQEMLAQQQAEVDRRIALSEADAAKAQGAAKDEEARALEAQQRENNKRKQQEYARKRAFTKALFASSGIVDSTGSALAVQVEQDTAMQLEAADNFYENQVQTAKLRFEGDILRTEAGRKGFAANAQFAISKNASRVREISARMNYRSALLQGKINRWYGGEQANIATTQAIGTGLSSMSSAAGGVSNYKMG